MSRHEPWVTPSVKSDLQFRDTELITLLTISPWTIHILDFPLPDADNIAWHPAGV